MAQRQGVRHDDIDGDSVLRWEGTRDLLPLRILRLLSVAFDIPMLDVSGLTEGAYQAQWLEFSPGGTRVLIEEKSPMLRRDFLRFAAGLAVGSLADQEQLTYVLKNLGRLDGRLIGDLEHLTAEHADAMWTTPPAKLLPSLYGHLAMLRRLMRTAVLPSGRQDDLVVMAGTASLVIARLEFQRQNPEPAAEHAQLAVKLASQAGDSGLLALARGVQARRYSLIHGQPDHLDGHLALTLLNAAVDSAPFASAHLLAWALTQRAHEHAAAGQDYQSYADLEAAQRAHSRAQQPATGYLAPWNRASEIDSVRGSAAALLGHTAAAAVILENVCGADDLHPVQHTGALCALATAYLTNDSPEVAHACFLLAEAVALADRHGLAEKVERVCRVRVEHLSEHVDEPAVRVLDDLILSVRQG